MAGGGGGGVRRAEDGARARHECNRNQAGRGVGRRPLAASPAARYVRAPFQDDFIPATMSEVTTIQVGQQVPDFELTTYEPTTKGFGKFSLSEAKKNGKWTLLFFYPADFTFV
jgi:hypothetical protein